MSLLQKWKQSRRRMAQMMGAPTGIRETGRRAPDTDDDVVSSRRTNRRDVAALVLEEIPVQAAPSRRVLFEAAEGSPPSTPPVAVFPTFLLKLFDYVCFRWFSYLRTPLAFDLARNQVVEQLSIHLIKTLVGRIGILRKSTRIILID
ncbi:hypothetical protein Y032_0180g794 [Ancylostoma ceylanicum]|nr:hypothetical protein Y032_0180g794 [Ancylostoma ceylanicum]